MSANILLLYPHQLYAAEHLPKDVDQIFLVEDPLLFGTDKQYPLFIHKQKLVLHRASMRRYVEEVLWPAGYQVEYIEFHHLRESGDIVNRLTHAAQVEFFDPTDDVLLRRLQAALGALESAPAVRIIESPNFYLSREEAKSFFQNKQKSNFAEFYRWQRERFNILINPKTYKPIGNKLMFDTEPVKRLPKNHKLPSFQVYGSNKFVDEARQYVTKHFYDNLGTIDDFPWPTSNDEALKWLDEFLNHRLDDFGLYTEAIDGDAPWMYHSGLSPLLNTGLLSPQQVIERTLLRHEKKEVPLVSLESFVRQILGWREFMRCMYLEKHVSMRTKNVFNHQKRLTNDWYFGTTGIEPLDDVLKKSMARGYAHHIERLMVIGNAMFLSEISPHEVYRWFMEVYIDAYDWTVVPNVYGLSQFADGGGDGSITSKPYISSSNYILSMSHYERGEWSDAWDGLYYRFIELNQEQLKKNAFMKTAVLQLNRLKDERRRIINYRADDFLREKTQD